MKKKIIAIMLSALMAVSVLTGCQGKKSDSKQDDANAAEYQDEEILKDEAPEAETGTIRIGAMSGATAMGLVRLKSLSDAGETLNTYEFADFATEASAMVPLIAKGELDMACVPANLASTLYKNTEGKVCVVSICVDSVLYIVERGEIVNTLSDLKDKKIYATGEGAIPECTLAYLLKENGMEIGKDVEVQWCADTTEALSYIQNDASAIAMLPQPFVTAACAQTEGLRAAIDLKEEWEKHSPETTPVTGVLVARKDFIDNNPAVVKTFIDEYKESVNYTKDYPEETANLIAENGIVPKAPLAQKALPFCGITCVTGEDMKASLSNYLNIIFELNPSLIGGELPKDDFYYGAE